MKKSIISLLASAVLFASGTWSLTADSKIEINGREISFKTPDLKTKLSLNETSLKGKKVKWEIEDPYIAAVEGDGTITSLSGGTTKVTATSDSEAVEFTVTVEEPARAPSADPVDPKSISGNIEIIMCGDSIMRDYKTNEVDQYGLGQSFKYFWNSSKVKVDNSVSNGGRSTRYFWNEPSRWQAVKAKLKANKESGKTTLVFFSFGHNDQRSLKGSDSKVGDFGASFTFAETNQNGTVAGTHYDYIERYITETRELGAIPVMVSPFVRKNFKNGKVSEKGRHNMEIASNGEKIPRGNYPLAMKKAAEKHNAIFVDMTALSAALVEKYNDEDKTNLLYISSDSTHERTLGALELAAIVTEDLKRQGYFAGYMAEPAPRIIASTKHLSFGRVLPEKESILALNLSFYKVNSGEISVKAPSGYSVSLTEKGEYSSALKIDCSKINYGTEIFVKFSPKKSGPYKGNLQISHSTTGIDFGNTVENSRPQKNIKVSLDGIGKEVIAGGKNFKITYPLINSENKYTAKADSTDDITASDVTVSGLEVLEPKREYSPDDDGDYQAFYSIPGGIWPVNDSGVKNDGMYIEFAVPANGKKLFLKYLTFYAGSYGSKNMRFHVYYSTNKKFKNPVAVIENGKSGYKDITDSFTSPELGINLKGKDTCYFRIYPACKDTKESQNQALMLSGIVLNGIIK